MGRDVARMDTVLCGAVANHSGAGPTREAVVPTGPLVAVAGTAATPASIGYAANDAGHCSGHSRHRRPDHGRRPSVSAKSTESVRYAPQVCGTRGIIVCEHLPGGVVAGLQVGQVGLDGAVSAGLRLLDDEAVRGAHCIRGAAGARLERAPTGGLRGPATQSGGGTGGRGGGCAGTGGKQRRDQHRFTYHALVFRRHRQPPRAHTRVDAGHRSSAHRGARVPVAGRVRLVSHYGGRQHRRAGRAAHPHHGVGAHTAVRGHARLGRAHRAVVSSTAHRGAAGAADQPTGAVAVSHRPIRLCGAAESLGRQSRGDARARRPFAGRKRGRRGGGVVGRRHPSAAPASGVGRGGRPAGRPAPPGGPGRPRSAEATASKGGKQGSTARVRYAAGINAPPTVTLTGCSGTNCSRCRCARPVYS
eukprot:ctg_393.g208